MPRGCFYGLENLSLQLKVPNGVFSEHPGVYRIMVKGAEMFNKTDARDFGAKIVIGRLRGRKRPVPYLSLFFMQTC